MNSQICQIYIEASKYKKVMETLKKLLNAFVVRCVSHFFKNTKNKLSVKHILDVAWHMKT